MTPTAHERALNRIELVTRDVADLARVASLAVRLEPHLLRRLRLELLPDFDVGTEGDLWFSSLVESRGVKFVVLDAGVTAVLRQSLASDPNQLDHAYGIVREAHAHSFPSINLEEKLHYLALTEGDHRLDAINEAFKPALRTMSAGGKPARDLAQWALRALPRLLAVGALECENGIALAMAASAVLGRRQVVAQVPEIDAPFERIAWVLPSDSLADKTTIAVELLDRGLRFLESGPPERTLELPATTPLLLELSWSAHGSTIATVVQAEPDRTIDLEVDLERLTIRTLAGDEYLLEYQMGEESAARVAPAEGREGWADAEEILETLRGAVAESYVGQARETVSTLVQRIHETDVPFPEAAAQETLQLLKRQRWSDLGIDLGSALIESGVATPAVRRLHAMTLIDRRLLDRAEKILTEMDGDTTTGEREQAEAKGLLGRIYKIRYLGADDPNARNENYLRRSIEAYQEGYELDPENRWCGVNVVALASRAARDGVELSVSVNPEAIAKRIVVDLERDVDSGTASAWDFATAGEAALALGGKEQALSWFERYVDDPGIDAFALEGTLHHLEELWQLEDQAIGGVLLKVLRSELLRREGGRVTLPRGPAVVFTESEMSAPRRPAVEWYETGLERARSVALVRGPDGGVFATGFLVEGRDLSETLASEGTLLMATSHAVAEPAVTQAAHRRQNDVMTFYAAGSTEEYPAKVVWSSPTDQLDVSLLRPNQPVQYARGLPLASQLPSADGAQRVYLIGYSQGSGRSFSLQNSTLLDYEGSRVRYAAPTEPGSSGSPVFDSQWNVIAIHHAGQTEQGEGISIQSIREAFAADAFANLGEQPSSSSKLPPRDDGSLNYWLREDVAELVTPALAAVGYGAPENTTFDDLPDRLPITESRSAQGVAYLIQLPDEAKQLSSTLQSIYRMTAGRFLFFADRLSDEIKKTLEGWSTEGLLWRFIPRGELPGSPPTGEAAVDFAARVLGLEAVSAEEGPAQIRVFLSYTNADSEWRERFRTFLGSVGGIALTLDTDLKAGDEWAQQIDRIIESADVAILLVTQNYLVSDFIQQVELPTLLRRLESGELQLIPVAVSPSTFEETPLRNIRFANDPGRPLDSLTPSERDRVLVEITRHVIDLRESKTRTTGEETRLELVGHTHAVRSVAYSPDGRRLATAGIDGTIRLWDAATGKELMVLDHTGSVSSVAYAPNGTRLATAGIDGTIRLWDAEKGKEITALRGHMGSVSSVVYSRDGRLLATAGDDGTIRLWDVKKNKELRVIRGGFGAVSSLAFSPAERQLATAGDDGTIRLWDTEKGEELRVLGGDEIPVLSVAYSPDGRHLVAGGRDGAVRLWDALKVGSFPMTGHTGPVWCVAYSPDGAHLATGSEDRTIRLWDAVKGKEVGMLTGHEGSVLSLAYSPDGRYLATGSEDRTIRIWESGDQPLIS